MIRLIGLARAAFEREESTAYARGYSHGCAGLVSLEWDCEPEHALAYARGYSAGAAVARGGV